jgi:hypothetical protein
MHRLQLPLSTSATPRAASLLLDRRPFISGFASAMAMTVLASAAPWLATASSEGWTVLRIMEGEFLMLSEKILGVWETISALPRVWECGRPTSTMERV